MDTMTSFAPQLPVQLEGELWGITAYFNPVGYRNKLAHMRLFAERVRSQGLKLLIVELAFDNAPFSLDESLGDRVLHVRSSSVLWQKERLLNIALDRLPDSCDKVAWLDADIFFESQQWVGDTSRLLQTFVVVQPYDVAWWLPPGVQCCSSEFSGDSFQAIDHGLAYSQSQASDRHLVVAHTGFAWAARRSLLASHGFYDRFVLGGGDLVMCWGMYGDLFRWPVRRWLAELCSQVQIDDLTTWMSAFNADVQGSVSFIKGRVFHCWHGAVENRQYAQRHRILKDEGFDPQADIALDDGRCWRWNSDKPDLHRKVKDYFWIRKEDHARGELSPGTG